jgi:glycogen debranching enzyme
VRTYAAGQPGYNPVGYHTGSIWPHDNAIIAAGLMRYGFVDAAHRVIDGVVAAAASFSDRLPELFAGLRRSEYPVPVRYPTSCSPQAWAAASPLLMLRAMLHLEPDLQQARLRLAPELPEWLGRVEVRGVHVMGGLLSFDADARECHVLEAPAGVTIVAEPGTPRGDRG